MKYPVVCFCIRRRFFYLLLSSVFLTYLSEGCCAKANERYNAILIFLQTKKASTNRVSLSATPKIAYQLREIIDPLSYALSVPVFCFCTQYTTNFTARQVQCIVLSLCILSFSFRSHENSQTAPPERLGRSLTSPHSLPCVGTHPAESSQKPWPTYSKLI